jgi:phosphopantetheinyl transferase
MIHCDSWQLTGYARQVPECLSEWIKFQYGEFGKPELKNNQQMSLQSNLSHANDITLYWFTLNRAIGIDVEYNANVREVLSVAD